jgi:hypothetical protein
VIAVKELISRPYLESQKALHAKPEGYGGKGSRWVSTVLSVATQYACGSILDYGCGRGSLGDAILLATGTRCREYDPAVSGKDHQPGFADLVVCTDVLEHIEPEKLPLVLEHLRSLARKAVFVVICTRSSNKTLADGRNAHLIVEGDDWWRTQCEAAGFTVKPAPAIHPVKVPAKAWIAVLEP